MCPSSFCAVVQFCCSVITAAITFRHHLHTSLASIPCNHHLQLILSAIHCSNAFQPSCAAIVFSHLLQLISWHVNRPEKSGRLCWTKIRCRTVLASGGRTITLWLVITRPEHFIIVLMRFICSKAGPIYGLVVSANATVPVTITDTTLSYTTLVYL